MSGGMRGFLGSPKLFQDRRDRPVKHRYPKWNVGKWNQGLKPAVLWWLLSTYTQVYIYIYISESEIDTV